MGLCEVNQMKSDNVSFRLIFFSERVTRSIDGGLCTDRGYMSPTTPEPFLYTTAIPQRQKKHYTI